MFAMEFCITATQIAICLAITLRKKGKENYALSNTHDQKRAIKCQTCKKYFRIKGGYAIHKCIASRGKTCFMTFALSPLKG